jgi:hypothetical protein
MVGRYCFWVFNFVEFLRTLKFFEIVKCPLAHLSALVSTLPAPSAHLLLAAVPGAPPGHLISAIPVRTATGRLAIIFFPPCRELPVFLLSPHPALPSRLSSSLAKRVCRRNKPEPPFLPTLCRFPVSSLPLLILSPSVWLRSVRPFLRLASHRSHFLPDHPELGAAEFRVRTPRVAPPPPELSERRHHGAVPPCRRLLHADRPIVESKLLAAPSWSMPPSRARRAVHDRAPKPPGCHSPVPTELPPPPASPRPPPASTSAEARLADAGYPGAAFSVQPRQARVRPCREPRHPCVVVPRPRLPSAPPR